MSNQFPHPFNDIKRSYKAMREKLPAQVSLIALQEFKDNFRKQGYSGSGGAIIKWAARKHADKQQSKRAILVKTARLKRSLRMAPQGDRARVITDVPYASIHNEGGKLTGTAKVRAFTRKKGAKVKAHTRKMNSTIPARPFMITTEKLLESIDRHIANAIDKLVNI